MDDDIISHGGDREPRPWPRRLTVIAALVVLVIGGGAFLTRSVVGQRSPVTARPTPTGSAALGRPAEPNGITQQTLAWDRNLKLPVAGTRPAWFSPASGRAAPIGGLPVNRAGYQFTRVVGGWAVQLPGRREHDDRIRDGTGGGREPLVRSQVAACGSDPAKSGAEQASVPHVRQPVRVRDGLAGEDRVEVPEQDQGHEDVGSGDRRSSRPA